MMALSRLAPILALALALTAVLATRVFADEPIIVRLAPVNIPGGSGGIATITAQGESATVIVDVGGLAPNSDNPIYVHAGTCATPSASFGNLGMLRADGGGKGSLTATTMRGSAGGAPVPLTLKLLADGDHVLVVAGQTIQACGAIPRAGVAATPATPSQLPRTGDPAAALLAGLAGGLGALLLAGGRRLRRR